MQTNHEIFLLVAEEMSISRAAKRAFVSQQCVSDHIKRLESSYNIQLFTRKPRFQLTEAGHTMLNSLQKIKAIESNLQDNLRQCADGTKGHFTMGISASRAQIILPWIMPEYNKLFPKVEVSFFTNDTIVLKENLLKGNVHLFLGVNTPYSEDLDFTPVCKDELCFMISDGLLKQHFNNTAQHILSNEINLKDFENVPFIKSYFTGAINSVLREHLYKYQINLSFPYQISDTDTQILLCSKGLGAVISSHMLLSRVASHNANCEKNEYIHVLPIKDFKEYLRIDLVSLKDINKPLYIKEFEDLLTEVVKIKTMGLTE